MKADLSVIILTYNEEKNIEACLKSIYEWVEDIYIVDSYSSDKTIEIVNKYTNKVYQHKFESYPMQRNWALRNIAFKTKWVMFLDADELVSSELREEIETKLEGIADEIFGIELKRRFIWMGKWIRHGGLYPIWLLRIMRHENARCNDNLVDEHFEVDGRITRLKNDLIHDNKKGIGDWIEKHNRYATLKAQELLKNRQRRRGGHKDILSGFWSSQTKRKQWIRERLWNRFIPPLIKPFFYFFYRYFLKLGFLDGKAGFIYHYLHGFWYRLIIDIKYLELRNETSNPKL